MSSACAACIDTCFDCGLCCPPCLILTCSSILFVCDRKLYCPASIEWAFEPSGVVIVGDKYLFAGLSVNHSLREVVRDEFLFQSVDVSFTAISLAHLGLRCRGEPNLVSLIGRKKALNGFLTGCLSITSAPCLWRIIQCTHTGSRFHFSLVDFI